MAPFIIDNPDLSWSGARIVTGAGPSEIWYVYELEPRDYFYDVTESVGHYINRLREGHHLMSEAMAHQFEYYFAMSTEMFDVARDRFADAVAAIRLHPRFEDDGLDDPRILYDPLSDGLLYLFKIRNNGTTFLVSAVPLPWITNETWSREKPLVVRVR